MDVLTEYLRVYPCIEAVLAGESPIYQAGLNALENLFGELTSVSGQERAKLASSFITSAHVSLLESARETALKVAALTAEQAIKEAQAAKIAGEGERLKDTEALTALERVIEALSAMFAAQAQADKEVPANMAFASKLAVVSLFKAVNSIRPGTVEAGEIAKI